MPNTNSRPLRAALISIARPTFDVPLAQRIAAAAVAALEEAGIAVVGTRDELLMDSTAAERAIAALSGDDFDALILMQASFADSSMAAQIAESVRERGVPLLLWAAPDVRDGGRLRINSLCGINLAGHALMRRGIRYDYLLSAPDDPEAVQKIAALARTGRALRLLRSARIGLFGEHPAGFDTCEYDEVDLRRLFGAEVVRFPLHETLRAAAQASAEDRNHFVEKAAALAPNLDEMDAAAVAGTGGVYTALHSAADEHQLDALAVRCWPEFFTELGCAACGAMSMLGNEMRPASCEADVNGTLTLVLLQALSREPAFIADLVSIDADSDTGVLWHCGLAPVSMADPESGIAATVHSNRKLPLLFEFALRPGRVTLARLHRSADDRHPYQLVIGGGEMVRAPRSFGGTSGVIRFDRPAPQVLDTIMRHGLEHHICLTYGDVRAELCSAAHLLDLPVLELC